MTGDVVARFENLKKKREMLERQILEKESKLQVHEETLMALLSKAETEYGSRDVEVLKGMLKEKEEKLGLYLDKVDEILNGLEG